MAKIDSKISGRLIKFAIVILIAGQPVSQVLGQHNHTFKFDLLNPFYNRYLFGYEHSVLPVFSVQVMVESGILEEREYSSNFFGNSSYKVMSTSVIPEIRYYPFRATHRWIVQPFIGARFRYGKFDEIYGTSVLQANIKSGILVNYGVAFGFRYDLKRISFEALICRGKGEVKYSYPNSNLGSNQPRLSYDFNFYQTRFYRSQIMIGYNF